MTPELAVKDADLLSIDLYADDRDDAGARCVSSRIVTTRKHHMCRFDKLHVIPIGSRARLEKAFVADRWGQFYVCCDCLISWLEEIRP